MADKPDKIFLTERRREYLNDPDSFSESARRVNYYRLRTRARMALDELIEVYESDAIPNDEVFPPEQTERLFNALFPDVSEITSRNEYDGSYLDWSDEYRYEDGLLGELQNVEMSWRLVLLGGFANVANEHAKYLQMLRSRTVEELEAEEEDDEE